MADKTLFLHIGFGKTGTSFIQSSLAFSRAELKNKGVHYPVLSERREGKYGLINSGNGYILSRLLNPALRNEMFETASAWHQLEESIMETSCDLVLISSEGLPSAKTSLLAELKDFLELRKVSIKVIVFLRSFLEHSFSRWSQGVKRHGFTHKWEEVCSSQHIPSCNVLTKYANVFGKDNILVFNYDYRRKNLLESFSNILGITEITPCPVTEVNRSLSALEMSRMLFLNALSKLSVPNSAKQISTTVSDLMVEVDPGIAERRIIQSRSAWESFQNNNKEIMESLNREYLPEEPVQMALRAPEFGEMILPELCHAEKHVLSAIHSFLANTAAGPQLDPDILAQLNEPSLYILSARVFQKQEMWDEAVWAATQAVQMAPQEPRAYLELAKGYEKISNFDAAMEAISKAIAMWPDMPDYQYLRGKLLHRLKRWPEAAAALTEAIQLNPALPGAHSQLSTALLHLGRFIKAYQVGKVAFRRGRIVRRVDITRREYLNKVRLILHPWYRRLKELLIWLGFSKKGQ